MIRMNGQINSMSEIDVATATFGNIRWRYGTFITRSFGERYNKTYSYRSGVQTALGDIEESVWCQLAETVIKREGEQQLLSWMVEWEKEHNYTKDPPAKLHQRALQLHVARVFDAPQWVYYIPFNKRYRPEVYAQAHIVVVINECCEKPGEVTQEQIDAAFDGTVACPHCGRWSKFLVPAKRKVERDPCCGCDCNDPDMGCTMSSIDRSYACPMENEYTLEGEDTHEKIYES